jgi:hypothetical protein
MSTFPPGQAFFRLTANEFERPHSTKKPSEINLKAFDVMQVTCFKPASGSALVVVQHPVDPELVPYRTE